MKNKTSRNPKQQSEKQNRTESNGQDRGRYRSQSEGATSKETVRIRVGEIKNAKTKRYET